jgi:hypothetical protein
MRLYLIVIAATCYLLCARLGARSFSKDTLIDLYYLHITDEERLREAKFPDAIQLGSSRGAQVYLIPNPMSFTLYCLLSLKYV